MPFADLVPLFRFVRNASSVLLLFIAVAIPAVSFAQTASTSTVQAQIDANTKQISALQSDIDQYQKQLNTLSTQKQTLQSNLKSISVTTQKTQTQLKVTQSQISTANLTLDQLGSQIQSKEAEIQLDRATLAASLRQIASTDNIPFIAALVSADTLVQAWTDIDTAAQLNKALSANAISLSTDTQVLSTQQQSVSNTKDQLTGLQKNLVTQQGQLQATAAAKKTLLAQTSSQESSYQKLIAQKKAQQAIFQNQLTSLENSLKSVSQSAIPQSGAGILAWPFSASVMNGCVSLQSALGNPYCITQYFGNTPFATANPSIYKGSNGHDGLDIGVPIGTPVEAALAGTVLATGNTDLAHDGAGDQCYSFGKWVMLEHSNGLNTMYAHLSVISVSKGQTLNAGDVLGYSGMTGYATGPHLHFGVYATAGVKIQTLGEFRGATTPCANATMPVAPANAYLNPLSYLL
ncbi:MAG: peptidoglycan DD-metalloendopeptidase family protein [Candidatus Pacebacteria bacterium]|nr:peptidoglycan DD-metalloendopeptidase family protein [Candidatus Paceibacterota bacterium]